MIQLWKHQQEAVEKARRIPNLAIFHGMGTGKTATTITILREEYNKQKRVCPTLIFAPLSVCQQWKNQFALFSKLEAEKIHVLTGAGKKRTEALAKVREMGGKAIVITNYEAVTIKDFYDELLKWSPEIIVLDESHMIKNSGSVRSKRIYPLGMAARRRFILTGTPAPENLRDLFGQFKFLDPSVLNCQSEWQFNMKYMYNKNANAPKHVTWADWQPRPGAAKEIAERIAPISVQAKKEECLDLPPLLDIQVPITMSPEQAKAYSQMEKDFITSIDDTVVAAEFAVTKTLRLRQILAGFIAEDSKAEPKWFKSTPTLEALRDILSQVGSEKVIVWTHFRPTYSVISSICDDLGLKWVRLTGDDSYGEKEKAKEAFKKGDAQVFISNPAAGGTGLDLPESSISIYYDLGYSSTQYRQSRERNHRGGSERHKHVSHYFLIPTGTVAEVIARALQSKQEISEAILDWAKKKQVALDKGKSYTHSGVKENELCQ